MFRPCNNDGLGSTYSSVVDRLRVVSSQHNILTTYLLVQACQHLWLVNSDEVYQQFMYINHTIKPRLQAALMLAASLLLYRSSFSFRWGHRPGSFTPPYYYGRMYQ